MRTRRNTLLKNGCIGCMTLPVLFCVLLLFRWRAQAVPDLPIPPAPPMPSPNARDTFRKAADLFKQSGGEKKFGLDKISPLHTAPVKKLRALVAANRPALATFRKGLRQPCQYPVIRTYTSEQPLYLGEVRLAGLIVAEGRVHEADRRWRAAADSYLDAYELGIKIGRKSSLLNGLIGVLIHAITMAPMDSLLDRCDPATAAHFAARMQRLTAAPLSFAEMMQEARIEQLVFLQAWGRGETKERMLYRYSSYMSPSSPAKEQMYQISDNLLRAYYRINKRDVLENHQRWSAGFLADLRKPYSRKRVDYERLRVHAGDLITQLQMPIVLSVATDIASKNMQARLLLVKAKLRAYAGRHGGMYPASLAALNLKPELLADAFRPAPLIYTPAKKRGGRIVAYRLYSVGPNGKDDGGIAGKDHSTGDLLPRMP